MDAIEPSVSGPIPLPAEGVDILVGSCDATGRPCVCRALSAEPDGARHFTVSLDRSAGAAVIAAIRDTRQVVVDIRAWRSVQLRGGDARLLNGDGRRDAFRFRVSPDHPPVAAPASVGASSYVLSVDEPTGAPGRRVGERARARLEARVRSLLEDGVPLAVCTASADGTPHLTRPVPAILLDERHLAIAVPNGEECRRQLHRAARAMLHLSDPDSTVDALIRAAYLRTETSGPAADRLRVRLAALAWHAGMSDVWHFDGADVLAVHDVRAAPGTGPSPVVSTNRARLREVRRLAERMADCDRLEDLIAVTMAGLESHLGMLHSVLWLLVGQRQRLVLLASHGYAEPGIGAELPLGHVVAGIAAATALPIRIGHLPRGAAPGPADRKPRGTTLCPTLSSPSRQLAVPLLRQGRVVGVLFVEDDGDVQCFDAEDEDALAILAAQLAASLATLPASAEPARTAAAPRRGTAKPLEPLAVRYYEYNSSVFLDETYLIKGVAGALFWKLVCAYVRHGRSEFSTRELRLCAAELHLPGVQDNLYTRLLLLQRRLTERAVPVRIVRTGRGRFNLTVERPLRLIEEAPPSPREGLVHTA